VTIDATKTREPMPDLIYGQFIEHLGRSIYGGIWAEMLEDRKFYSDVGETRRIVTPEVGWTVPMEAPALARILADAVRNTTDTLTRGRAAARIARTEYTADAYAASLETLYHRAVSLHRGEPCAEHQEGHA
jgi:hypothetical protein